MDEIIKHITRLALWLLGAQILLLCGFLCIIWYKARDSVYKYTAHIDAHFDSLIHSLNIRLDKMNIRCEKINTHTDSLSHEIAEIRRQLHSLETALHFKDSDPPKTDQP